MRQVISMRRMEWLASMETHTEGAIMVADVAIRWKRLNRLVLTGLAALVIATVAVPASAQQGRTYSAGRTGGGGGGELPFANSTYRRPAVSPYNNLSTFQANPYMAQNVYSQQIQPLLQQQQQQIEQLSQRRQVTKLQNQVQQIGRDTTSRQVDESIRATGHRATYMNYSHYYQ